MTISPLLSVMLAAAETAGQGLLADQARISSLTIRNKAGVADMFSEADLRAEETVKAALMAHAPTYGFLGEEGGLQPGSDASHVWIVDPLDGTTNFLTEMCIRDRCCAGCGCSTSRASRSCHPA